MNFYIELQLLPDAEVSLDFLWQKVYQQVHIALVDNKVGENESAIAISFPSYHAGIGGEHAFPLGNQLRLLANEERQLTNLNINQWLNRLKDYVHIKSIKPVPEKVRHVAFFREKVKGEARIEKDMQSKAKRWAEKSGQTLETCLAELEKTKPKADNSLPFIWLESQETKQRNAQESRKFPLFIKMVSLTKEQAGVFNCYGLNTNSSNKDKLTSVPQF
ncbi:hypothetical protein NBRC116592_15160 [Colwellia sp. KU-HH00111]|uniref:type I-F CRISPR-associated endoribonuclease Cas6/Csy4 n=1 Tax=Colwellia sp. KU-HH00111 TaxID=3127652 RepID=UPI0031028870